MYMPLHTVTEHDQAEFQAEVARDMIRLAADHEGLQSWLAIHGGSVSAPSVATRRLAYDIFGDTEDAILFNTAMIFQLDRQLTPTL